MANSCPRCLTPNSPDRRGCIACGAVLSSSGSAGAPGQTPQTAPLRGHAGRATLSSFGKKCLVGLFVCVFGGGAAGAYAVFFSGSQVTRMELKRGSVVDLGLVSIATSGEVHSRVGPVTLSPEMNPVRVILKANYRPGRTRARTSYAVTMRTADGREIWTRTGSLSTDKDSRSTTISTSVKLFSVSDRADVVFDASFGDSSHVSAASLSVRRNSASLSPASIAIFVIGGFLSVVGLFVDRYRSRRAALAV